MAQEDLKTREDYNEGFSVSDLFIMKDAGIVTARDHFTIHYTLQNLKKTINEFLRLDDEAARVHFSLGKDVRDWKVDFAKKDLSENYPEKGKFTQITYRPFDIRFTFYTGNSKGFHCYPKGKVMTNFLQGSNPGLVYKLGNAEENAVSCMVSENIITFRSWSRPGMQGGDYIAPLYLYPETSEQQSKDNQQQKRTPNLNPKIVFKIEENLQLTFVPEKKTGGNVCMANSEEVRDDFKTTFAPIDLLDYIYAVLHSPDYREKYKEFLKIDFPRVPYPQDSEKFWRLVKPGGALRQLHLLESPLVEQYITGYPEDGDNVITRKITKTSPGYEPVTETHGKVWINDRQYFENVPLLVWEFYIGGYQPAQKWLKDRKGRDLSYEDILHYQKIIVALTETNRLMKEIDEVGIVEEKHIIKNEN